MGNFRFRRIVEQAASHYEITAQEVLSKRRHQPIVSARHLAMWLVRNALNLSLQETAEYFGMAHHTTALHALRKVEVHQAKCPVFAHRCAALLAGCRSPDPSP